MYHFASSHDGPKILKLVTIAKMQQEFQVYNIIVLWRRIGKNRQSIMI